MCITSADSRSPAHSSTTWAASVPSGLAEAIAAAVGPQPVPQQPAKPTPTMVGQPSQHPPPQQAWSVAVQASPAASCGPVDALLPVDIMAASSPAQCPALQQVPQQEVSRAAAAACYDNMDSLILDSSAPQQLQQQQQDAVPASDAAVVVAALGGGAAHKASDLPANAQQLSQQQQQQLLNQLWSELQAPQQQLPASAAAECCYRPQGALHSPASAASGLHSAAGSCLRPSSSLCSSDQAGLAAAALAAAAAATAVPAVTPDSPCSSAPSRALSSCSTSSSKKRVSWGDAVVYQLPPEPPTPLLTAMWRRVRHWWMEDAAACYEVLEDGSRALSPAAAATTALVSVAAVAAVAALVAHRTRSS